MSSWPHSSEHDAWLIKCYVCTVTILLMLCKLWPGLTAGYCQIIYRMGLKKNKTLSKSPSEPCWGEQCFGRSSVCVCIVWLLHFVWFHLRDAHHRMAEHIQDVSQWFQEMNGLNSHHVCSVINEQSKSPAASAALPRLSRWTQRSVLACSDMRDVRSHLSRL